MCLRLSVVGSRCTGGSYLTFQEFQRSAAAGRNMRHLVAEAQLIKQPPPGSAATDNRRSIDIRQRLRYRDRAAGKVLDVSNTPIGPFQTTALASFSASAKESPGLGAEAQSHFIRLHAVLRYHGPVHHC